MHEKHTVCVDFYYAAAMYVQRYMCIMLHDCIVIFGLVIRKTSTSYENFRLSATLPHAQRSYHRHLPYRILAVHDREFIIKKKQYYYRRRSV